MEKKLIIDALRGLLTQVEGQSIEFTTAGNPPVLDEEDIILTPTKITRFAGTSMELVFKWDEADDDELEIILEGLAHLAED